MPAILAANSNKPSVMDDQTTVDQLSNHDGTYFNTLHKKYHIKCCKRWLQVGCNSVNVVLLGVQKYSSWIGTC